MKKKIRSIILLLIGFIILGTYAYHQAEGWNYLNSLYFVIVTITTIGYGDFTPQSVSGKIFTMFFSFFGITIAFYLFSVIGSYLFKKHLGRKVSEIKREVEKQQEIKQDVKETIKEAIGKNSEKKSKKKS